MGTLRNALQNDPVSEYIHYNDSPLGGIMVSGEGIKNALCRSRALVLFNQISLISLIAEMS